MAVRFVQLTDTHITAEGPVRGVDTAASFRAVVAAVERETPPPDFVLISGDLVNDARPESYAVLRDLLTALPWPVRLAMGNHDDRAALRRIVLGEPEAADAPYRYAFAAGGTTFLVLDSWERDTQAGRLDRAQLDWLDAELARSPGPAVVCVHHPPLPTGIEWIDRLRLVNGEALIEVLARHANVRLLLCGHIHQVFETRVAGIPLLTTPSTCFQFGTRPDRLEISDERPGYRVVSLDDGRVATEVKRV